MQQLKNKTFAPPIKGLVVESALTQASPEYAISLVNFIPKGYTLEVRKGYTTYASVDDVVFDNLIAYFGKAGSKLIAIDSTNSLIYDVTDDTSITDITPEEPDDITFSASWFKSIMFKDNAFIFSPSNTNTTESIYVYNGTTIADAGITDDASPLLGVISMTTYNGNLYMVINKSMTYHYIPSGAITGDTTTTDLSDVFSKGGYLINVNRYTRDGSDGLNDLLIFTSSNGQCAVYTGLAPSEEDWQLIGVIDIPGQPHFANCTFNYGSQFLICTDTGVYTLSGATSEQYIADFSSGINEVWQYYYNFAKSYDYFDIIKIPSEDLLIHILPFTPTSDNFNAFGFVGNNKAWTQIKELPLQSTVMIGDNVYAVNADGAILKLFDGYSDNGSTIIAGMQTPYFTVNGAYDVRVDLIQPLIATGEIGISPSAKTFFNYSRINNYDVRTGMETPIAGTTAGVKWNTVKWNTVKWSQQQSAIVSRKITQRGMGNVTSFGITVAQKSTKTVLTSYNVYYQQLNRGGYYGSRNQ